MVWCSNCVKNVAGSRDETGFLYCDMCGKVLDFYNFSQDPTFTKDAGGQSQLSGNFVRSIQSNFSASRERTLNKAFEDMRYMRNGLNMGESDEIIRVAGAFYRIALERNFTRGRNTEFVQAACLYIACREKNKPYLLIDFSNYLRINVYVLGAVFLQLCKVLRLEEHPIVQKPVDPSLFIDKFTQCLLGGTKDDGMKKEVSRTALKIITSMKRDWMQTGRKPSGLCGAALYISALSNGVKCSKSDIIKIVHICDATLTKRLIEFENTESGSLTMEEFIVMADKIKGSNSYTHNGLNATSDEVLCVHKNECKKPYALGLCKSCYDDFVELSGGLDGGSNPPAFQCAEKERTEKSMVEEGSDDSSAIGKFFQGLNPCTNTEKGSDNVHADASKTVSSKEAEAKDEQRGLDDGATKAGADGPGTSASDESENWSDIDDIEVDGYLHNEEEKHYKKIIWEEMNRDEKFTAEQVEIIYEATGEKHTTPLLSQRACEAKISEINGTLGLNLTPEQICKYCERMQLGPATYQADKQTITVNVPPTRSDILHAVDVIEDVAIAYGFNNIPVEVPKTVTFGAPLPINHFTDLLRAEIARAGFMEMLTHGLCSTAENFTNLQRPVTNAVSLSNPANVEYEVVRTTLIPGALKTLAFNNSLSHKDGIRLYEISDVVLPVQNDIGAKNERHLVALSSSMTANFEVIHGLADKIMTWVQIQPEDTYAAMSLTADEIQERKRVAREGKHYYVRPSEDPLFFPGMSADVILVDRVQQTEVVVGSLGVVHPNVLKNFEVDYPCSIVEMNLELLL